MVESNAGQHESAVDNPSMWYIANAAMNEVFDVERRPQFAHSTRSPPTLNTSRMITSLGLFILDTFEFSNLETGEIIERNESMLGGGGLYAIVGARIWSVSPTNASKRDGRC